MRNVPAILASLFSLGISMAQAATVDVLPTVTVEGVLLVGTFFGPPNYGENPGTDRLERSYFLQLPAPLVTQLKDSGAVAGLNQQSQVTYFVQLIVIDKEQARVKQFIGKRVRVVGAALE